MQLEFKSGYKNSEYSRILGGNLQGNLLWSSHLETGERALFPLVRKQMGMLKHKGKLIPKTSRNNLARSLILSRINYLMPLWGGASKKYMRKTQVLVNTAARWVTGKTRRARTRDLMKATGWFTVEEQVKIATSIFTWKLVHKQKPERLMERMTLLDDWSLQVREPRLHLSKGAYRWRAGDLWNSYPLDLRQEVSIAKFKRRIKQLVKEQRTWDTED